jgi:hypothetical protein
MEEQNVGGTMRADLVECRMLKGQCGRVDGGAEWRGDSAAEWLEEQNVEGTMLADWMEEQNVKGTMRVEWMEEQNGCK